MRRSKARFWICRHGHPMWRKPVTGHWICHTCNELNRSKGEMTYCVHGHKRPRGTGKNCSVCARYYNAPWLKELDREGHAVCPNGHEVSHYNTESVVYVRTKKQMARYCRGCLYGSLKKAQALKPDATTNPMCAKGLHPRTEENTLSYIKGKRQCKPCWEESNDSYRQRRRLKKQRQSELKPRTVDWVVVERLLAKGSMDYLRRGRTLGATDGERWVAYCTFRANNGGKHPEECYGEPGYDAMTLWKMSAWRNLGKKHGWREFTLHDLMSIIHTPEYVSSGFLRKKKRENPR